ncbi:MAG: hypothetical protein P9L99_21395 [Candidatus Lernaella stagnicola]|nr:hypothetical protein [Candidatus Lernaella stagnicola]
MTRRWGFAAWLLVSLFFSSFMWVNLPACVIELLRPRPSRWKSVLLTLRYGTFAAAKVRG